MAYIKNIDILIVDDHQIYRQTLNILLKHQRGIRRVEEAENGLECMEILKKNKFDLILMDIQMPKMNGIETTQKIIENYPNTIVLGMSIQATESDIKRLEIAGASGFIEKGFTFNELQKIIDRLIDGAKYFKTKPEPKFQ